MKHFLSRQGHFWFFLAGFYVLWILAWLFRTGPLQYCLGTSLQDPNNDTLYWLVMKCLVWILPVTIYLRQVHGMGLWEYLDLSRWTQWRWGLVGSVSLGGICLVYDLLMGRIFIHPSRFILGPFINIVLVSPLLEEIFFRGFFIRQLGGWWKNFGAVNLAASLAWVTVHWIGWYFQGKISFPGTIAISLQLAGLGFFFGYMNRWAGSLWTSICLHMTYNLYSTNFWNYFMTSGNPS